MNKSFLAGLAASCILGVGIAQLATANERTTTDVLDQGSTGQSFDEELTALKGDIVELDAELAVLEEEILYPEETQLVVFLSLEATDSFQLDSVEFSVDGDMVSSHLYSGQEHDALQRGGIQRLYIGNILPGEHTVTVRLNGNDPEGQYVRKEQSFTVNKTDDAEKIELAVQARAPASDPEIALKRWE